MLKKGLVTSIGLLAIAVAASGKLAVAGIPTLNGQAAQELREEFKQTYQLSPTGRVSIENINGAVRINVWDRNEVQVTAVKRAYRPERLAEARIDVHAASDSIRIKTQYPPGSQSFTNKEGGRINNPAVVDYTLTVPRQARLDSVELINGELQIEGAEGDVRASSINGRVTARGLMGEARLSTVNGPLEVTFTRLADSKPIQLNSVNGSVVLTIPSDASAVIRAGTVHGAIKNDFGLSVHHGNFVGHDLHGQLGSGGPRIRLGNVNGSITIKQAQDGRKRSSATDLAPQGDKDKTVKLISGKQKLELRQVEREVQRAEREAAKAARLAEVEVQREVERALLEAQREIQRAQVEAQREAERRIREQVRRNATSAEASAKSRATTTAAARRSFVDKETGTFVVTGKPRVNIATFEGTVKVQGWDKSEVMYTATKRGSDPKEAKQIVIRKAQQGSGVSVIASSSEGIGAANLEVFVPREAIVTATSTAGSLSVKGVSGDITLRTGDGPIEIADGSGKLIANTGDGRIRVVNFEGQIEARTGDGPVSLDGRFAGLFVRTGHGNISLRIPADSNFTIETNVETVTNEGLTLTEDVAPSKRVKRWRVGRGGNVFTLNTGEGKLVLQPRK